MHIEVIEWSRFKSSLAYPSIPSEPKLDPFIKAVAVTGVGLESSGDCSILVISRVPRKVNADEPWLSRVREAIKYTIENDWIIVSSVGNLGWDYITWYAARSGATVWLALPPQSVNELNQTCADLSRRLKLDVGRTSFLIPITLQKLLKTDNQQLRDKLALSLAGHRLPIYIRPGGNWSSSMVGITGVDRQFSASRPRTNIESWRNIKEELIKSSEGDWGDLLIHWTRGTYGAWRGEVDADYFEALTEATSGNPRDALATLEFIAASGILRGEGRMIKDSTPVISFSDLPPSAALKQIEFRPTLGRWSYEPCGITFPRKLLEKLGARRVIYGDKEFYEQLSTADKPYYQYHGNTVKEAMKHNWTRESEWRITGDIDLLSLKDQVFLITPTEMEADRLRRSLPYRVVSLERGLSVV